MADNDKNDKTGRLLNQRYRLLRPVGSGGMAEVYLAHDELLDRDVAVKMLRREFTEDKALLEQFRREAKSAARLIHPYIINIYDVACDGQEQYIVMEYVQGTTLKEFLHNNRLSVRSALELAAHLANALEHAHNRNIIHCDIKPQNILIDQELNPKIADFGIAKMISSQTVVFSGSVMGSVHYLSPEQADGGQITAASDVYSLGVVLFEMLTGHVPYTGTTAVAVAMMHAAQPVPQLSAYLTEVPEGLQEIIDKAMAKKPEQRYANASQLRRDLQELLAQRFGAEEGGYNKELRAIAQTLPAPAAVPAPKDGDATVVMRRPSARQAPAAESVSDTKTLPLTNRLPTEIRQVPKASVTDVLLAKLKLREGQDMGSKDNKETQGRTLRKKRRINWTRLLLLITALVVAISFCAHFIFSRSNRLAEVPDVVNMTVVEAQKALEEKNFKVELEESYSDDKRFRPGTVMEQSVKAGEQRRERSVVRLTISRGAELKPVPDLTGMSLTKAEKLLEDDGFTLGRTSRKYVKGARIGSVLSTSPKAGEKSPKGSAIDLVICEGDKPVPNIIGKPLEEAQKLLSGAGLTLGEVHEVTGSERKGTVKSANPGVGSNLGAGDKVSVTISAGPASKSAYVEFVVPGDRKKHEVEIILNDANGRTTLYKGSQKGGVRLRQKVEYAGQAVLSLISDGKTVEEKSL